MDSSEKLGAYIKEAKDYAGRLDGGLETKEAAHKAASAFAR